MTVPPLTIDVIIEAPGWRKAVKGPVALCERAARAAVEAALPGSGLAGLMSRGRALELCVALEDDDSVRALNRDFRDRDAPTNVLAFPALEAADGSVLVPPADGGDDEDPEMLGDVIIALETTRDEASREGKSLADHLTHLVVHGVLHLLGHDHQTDIDADRMERLETRVLAALGIADPYAPEPDQPTRDPGTGDHEQPIAK